MAQISEDRKIRNSAKQTVTQDSAQAQPGLSPNTSSIPVKRRPLGGDEVSPGQIATLRNQQLLKNAANDNNPSSMVSAGFSQVNTGNQSAATNSTAARQNIRPAQSPQPTQNNRDVRSLAQRQEPARSKPEALSSAAAANLSKDDAALAGGLIAPKKKETLSSEQGEPQERSLRIENNDDIEAQDLAASTTPVADNDNQENLTSLVRKEMKKHGVILNPAEAQALINSNFKVKFPWLMLCIAFGMWMLNIEYFWMGVAIEAMGGLIKSINSIPFIGNIVYFFLSVFDMTLSVLGVAVFIVDETVSIIYQVILFFWGKLYARNAVDFSSSISHYRKTFRKNFNKRAWMLSLGWIPLIGELLDIVMILIMHFHARKQTRIASTAVKKARSQAK